MDEVVWKTCEQCRGTGRYVLADSGSTNLETINCPACGGRGVIEYKQSSTAKTND